MKQNDCIAMAICIERYRYDENHSIYLITGVIVKMCKYIFRRISLHNHIAFDMPLRRDQQTEVFRVDAFIEPALQNFIQS